MRKLDKTETYVLIGDMTYLREVTETDFYNCVFISSLIQSAFFLVCLN